MCSSPNRGGTDGRTHSTYQPLSSLVSCREGEKTSPVDFFGFWAKSLCQPSSPEMPPVRCGLTWSRIKLPAYFPQFPGLGIVFLGRAGGGLSLALDQAPVRSADDFDRSVNRSTASLPSCKAGTVSHRPETVAADNAVVALNMDRVLTPVGRTNRWIGRVSAKQSMRRSLRS